MRVGLRELFECLDTTPEDRAFYASDELQAYPCVNGGLFQSEVDIPQFTDVKGQGRVARCPGARVTLVVK